MVASERASTAKPGTASTGISEVSAGAVSGSTLARRGIRKWPKRRFCALIRSAPPCGDLLGFLACRATRSQSGSKKAQNLPPLEATLVPAQTQDALELDELWNFVRHRRRGVIWLWLALCRRIRQSVAYALGLCNDATAGLLWSRTQSNLLPSVSQYH